MHVWSIKVFRSFALGEEFVDVDVDKVWLLRMPSTRATLGGIIQGLLHWLLVFFWRLMEKRVNSFTSDFFYLFKIIH